MRNVQRKWYKDRKNNKGERESIERKTQKERKSTVQEKEMYECIDPY